MIRVLLIATLVLLQLPQAIAGSMAICFCANTLDQGVLVAADQTHGCDHCHGDCHASHAARHDDASADEHSKADCRPVGHSHCTDCLHLSLFAGDTLRGSVQPATIDIATWEATSTSLLAPIFAASLPLELERADFWITEAGPTVTLRC